MSSHSKLDRLDLNILGELQRRGRIAIVTLADLVGLSANPCLARVKRLEKEGYISGYGASINLERLGSVQVAFAKITLHEHRREDLARFVEAMHSFDEVMECHHATGGYDYMLKVVTRDIDDYRQFVKTLLDRGLNIESIVECLVCQTRFVKAAYPFKSLFQREHKGVP